MSCDNLNIIPISKAKTSVNDDNNKLESEKQQNNSMFPYNEPNWSALPTVEYKIEELKSGVIERNINLSERSFTIIGRSDNCHVTLAHPTISRFHAVLQYRKDDDENIQGLYLFDMGSTHGTFLNKSRIKPQIYVRLKTGHMIKFGCSTRMFIIQGPDENNEKDLNMSIQEFTEKKKLAAMKQQAKIMAEQEKVQVKDDQEIQEQSGIDWGMGEDADEETDLSVNPYAFTTNEETYSDNPKKELRKWFDREGEELHFEIETQGKGSHLCKVLLPTSNGDIVIEGNGKSKKDAISQCALEACRYLDRQDLLKISNRDSKKRRSKNWEENDYYDSDEDEFLDRTGQIENKRQKRMFNAGKLKQNVETYQTLMVKNEDLLDELNQAEKHLSLIKNDNDVVNENNESDELDVFMETLKKSTVSNKMEIKLWKQKILMLKQEIAKVQKLIDVAKPVNLPELQEPQIHEKSETRNKSADKNTEIEDNQLLKKSSKIEKILAINETKLLGPSLEESSADVPEISKKKKKRVRNRPLKISSDTLDIEDYNNLTWQPPTNQTGDGRTSLNDKFGY